jgi:hypothetical protein
LGDEVEAAGNIGWRGGRPGLGPYELLSRCCRCGRGHLRRAAFAAGAEGSTTSAEGEQQGRGGAVEEVCDSLVVRISEIWFAMLSSMVVALSEMVFSPSLPATSRC